MEKELDIVIVGGGPAGSTAATFLARAGKKVLIVEKDRFPRFQIGESLLPCSMDTLDRLGVTAKMEAAGFLPKHGAHISSGHGDKEIKFYFKNSFRSRRQTAFQVPRAEFDYLLLEHARENGAEVHYETRVTSVDFSGDGANLQISGPGGVESLRTRYVLDCSGRNSLLGSKFGLKKSYPGLKKFAVYAHFEGVKVPDGPDGTLTQMIREENRWFWIIPLSRSKLSIGLVMDLDEFKKTGLPPSELLEKAIAGQPLVGRCLEGGARVTPVHCTGDYSYRNKQFFGDRWLLAGDAAGFIDPVFSSGVFLAIFSGERSANVLQRVLDGEANTLRAFRQYARDLNRVMDLYQKFVEGWYRQEFIETILNPQEFFHVVPAVNAVLAGNTGRDFSLLWRLWLFQCLVAIQRRLPLSPRLCLRP